MSIYDAIGGAPAVSAAVDEFYRRVTGDPSLADFFTGRDMARLKGHQRTFIAAALGGPEIFKGRSMAEAHGELNITDADFDAVVGHLADTLASLGVDAETIGSIAEKLAPLREQVVGAPASTTAS